METVMQNIEAYGYAMLFIYSLGGGFVGIVAAGALSGFGYLNIFVSIAVVFAANTLGDQALFFISRSNKSAITPYLRRHRRKLALSHMLLKKHGARIIIIKKFIYGLKTLIPIVAGFTKYDAKKFLALNAIGALLFALIFGWGSYFAGEFFSQIAIYASDYPYILPIALIMIIGGSYLLVGYFARKKIKRRD
ncbi:MAG: DedA family protein [Helicobacteraceae bacterium]|jgi:membrane protein DedA with SNARE-associated domain|nr:DedA family protein [Helicobacteraceae bacterium]